MNNYSDIEQVRLLVGLLEQKGIRRVVLSPGSRNAPLTVSVARSTALTHYVVVDERSAAFFALGLAQQSGETVALVSTSGTALLNYAPGIAEAYYQGVPLLVLSADRPPEWIDQDDSQAIRQQGVFSSFVKGSFQLPVSITCDEERWHTNRVVNEAVNLSQEGFPGPVHLNIPLREPLYGFHSQQPEMPRVFSPATTAPQLQQAELLRMQHRFSSSSKVMVIAGFNAPDSSLREIMERLATFQQVVVLAESPANLSGGRIIPTIDRVLAPLSPGEAADYAPDLLITFGGALISRMIKSFIRSHPPREHWHIDRRTLPPDTCQSLTHPVPMGAASFFRQLCSGEGLSSSLSDFASRWEVKNKAAALRHEQFIQQAPWCDLKAFSILWPQLPPRSHLQLGNSTPVRYAQLFGPARVERTDSNRGTSGIEGSLSTAIGASIASGKETIVITGDLCFLYDSNALWNRYLTPHLKIIVMANGGGGIFRFLPGSSALEEVEELFETPHRVGLGQLVQTHRLELFEASDKASLQRVLPSFFEIRETPSVLLIETSAEISGNVLKGYFNFFHQPIPPELENETPG